MESKKYFSSIISPKVIHKLAVGKGWWKKPVRPIPECLMLIVSELSEALEAYRNDIPEGKKGCMSEELADADIREFDLAEHEDLDIIQAIYDKHMINVSRPYRHGGKKA